MIRETSHIPLGLRSDIPGTFIASVEGLTLTAYFRERNLRQVMNCLLMYSKGEGLGALEMAGPLVPGSQAYLLYEAIRDAIATTLAFGPEYLVDETRLPTEDTRDRLFGQPAFLHLEKVAATNARAYYEYIS